MRAGKTTIVATMAVLGIALVGCGGGGGAPNRVEFIKRADAICRQVSARQRAATREFWVQHPGIIGTPNFRLEEQGWKEDLVEFVMLPPIQTEAKELRRLQPPDDDAKEIKLIVKGLERGVRKGVKYPSTLVEEGSVGPFRRVEALARSYGFGFCADPPLNP
jgi:hypothetical protein